MLKKRRHPQGGGSLPTRSIVLLGGFVFVLYLLLPHNRGAHHRPALPDPINPRLHHDFHQDHPQQHHGLHHDLHSSQHRSGRTSDPTAPVATSSPATEEASPLPQGRKTSNRHRQARKVAEGAETDEEEELHDPVVTAQHRTHRKAKKKQEGAISWMSLQKVTPNVLSEDGSFPFVVAVVPRSPDHGDELVPGLRLRITPAGNPQGLGLSRDQQAWLSLFKLDPGIGQFEGKANVYRFRNIATGSFLSRELNGQVALDRPWAKSFEHWAIKKVAVAKKGKRKPEIHCTLHPATDPEGLVVIHSTGPTSSTGFKVVPSASSGARTGTVNFELLGGDDFFPQRRRFEETSSEVVAQSQEGVEEGGEVEKGTSTATGIHLVIASTAKPLSKMTAEGKEKLVFVLQSWLELLPPHPENEVTVVLCWDDEESTSEATEFMSQQHKTRGDPNSGRMFPERQIRNIFDCEKKKEYNFDATPTYRGLFASALQMGRVTEKKRMQKDKPQRDLLLMFVNADIFFPKYELAPTLHEALRLARKQPRNGTEAALQGNSRLLGETDAPHQFMVTGRRRNCDVDTQNNKHWREDLVKSTRSAGGGLRSEESKHSGKASGCSMFGEDAQDYFVVTPHLFDFTNNKNLGKKNNSPHSGRVLPELVVGGIAFDNFFVSQANKVPNAFVLDATATVRAFHLNHGGGRFDSHHDPKSLYNSRTAHEAGGWARGKVTLANYASLPFRGSGGAVLTYERHVVKCNDDDSHHLGDNHEDGQERSGGGKCTTLHFNQLSHKRDAPDAFSQPWKRPD